MAASIRLQGQKTIKNVFHGAIKLQKVAKLTFRIRVLTAIYILITNNVHSLSFRTQLERVREKKRVKKRKKYLFYILGPRGFGRDIFAFLPFSECRRGYFVYFLIF